MKSNQSILTYILAFFAFSILLKIIGVINFNISEIIGYALIFYGISQVYILFGSLQKFKLFYNTFIFLAGIFLFLINNFEFVKNSQLIIPSIFFIFSISFLMVFIENFSNKTALLFSIIFLLCGLLYTIFTGSPKLITFLNSIGKVFLKYLPLLLIIAGIIFLISRNKPKV